MFWCSHEFVHEFIAEPSCAVIRCYCWKCGKRRAPDHYWPETGDRVLQLVEWTPPFTGLKTLASA